jgi:hypothetical protein
MGRRHEQVTERWCYECACFAGCSRDAQPIGGDATLANQRVRSPWFVEMSGRADDGPPNARGGGEASLQEPLISRHGTSIQAEECVDDATRATQEADGLLFPNVAEADSEDHDDRVERFLWPTVSGSSHHSHTHRTSRRLSWQFPGWGGIVQDMSFVDDVDIDRSTTSSYRSFINNEHRQEEKVHLRYAHARPLALNARYDLSIDHPRPRLGLQ